ncbi:hypothetical protein GIB67_005507 [Kingdonia uniflora]|uniref:Uncharacterized protein n=1 Tax=Kingdonia uniflora TaxID=39325 RepID=A0A7J7NHH9_9MAGN|nr:hypothetical protein GIB67_005507 [Kingdonia uniflora]
MSSPLEFGPYAIVVRTRLLFVRTICKLSRVFDQISRNSFERLLVLFERISSEIILLFKETLVFFSVALFSRGKIIFFLRAPKDFIREGEELKINESSFDHEIDVELGFQRLSNYFVQK